ncbi:transporter substrate-binding domain-containing protein [Pollutimonas harenae]|uniref:Transporter substrate-binding domain-containing protein n=1 Tax=Pollutimonas harenae TaxID=657015 RepID=A0A853H4Q2_9BURK|nr:transporter substrate-binding domain-containing protein [Pollutimonas harenae]NYT86155.1 transporter substrate-binding domain-containing protein [Pollutimonas harenae]TEA71192.1 transporter substrate-binding domain-containing protein [Pollutimonas harenae]
MKPLFRLVAGVAMAMTLGTAAQAGPRLDRIMDSQTIRVGTPGDYRPFAIKTDKGYEGHDIDVIEAMAKVLGVKVDYVQTSWPNLLKDLQADKFDVAVGGITRNVARIKVVDMLPGYAPFGKVALVRKDQASKYKSVDDLNQASVRVIKNPGGTNEAFVLENLKKAKVSTHEKNAEIPALIAEGKGDVMITETYEALHYSKADPRLAAVFVENPLTPENQLGFMLPVDDADYVRLMNFAWDLLDDREVLEDAEDRWLD